MARLCSMLRMLFFYGSVVASIAMASSSCVSTKGLRYMQGSFDTAKYTQVPPVNPLIQKGDLLGITVYSDNPDANRSYNLAQAASVGGSAGGTEVAGAVAPAPPGYMVDEAGNIEFQGLGLIHVDGLTRSALKDTLNARLSPFLSHPYYSIRILNYRFTMLGEIAKPGIYTLAGDRINLFEALGMAGDMTFYGRRDSVLVVRETEGKREFARLNLTKPEILGSPYFYLQPNDVVIFEPGKNKVIANDQTTIRNLTIVTSLVSIFVIIYTIFR